MGLENICPPAILYIAFSVTHIIIDTVKGMYNTALIKFIVMIIFTLVLNILCQLGLSFVSWIIVFIPFIMMTIISSLLLFTFGLSPQAGKLNYNVDYPHNGRHDGRHDERHNGRRDERHNGRRDERHNDRHDGRHNGRHDGRRDERHDERDNGNHNGNSLGKHPEWHKGYKYNANDKNIKNNHNRDDKYYSTQEK